MSDKDSKAHRVYDLSDVRITVDGVDITSMTVPEPGVFYMEDVDGSEWHKYNEGDSEDNNGQH